MRDSKLPILHLCKGDLPRGGTERVAMGLTREFRRKGLTVRTFFPDWAQPAALRRWFEEIGVEAEIMPPIGNKGFGSAGFQRLQATTRIIRATKPGLVHIHFPGSSIEIMDILATRLSGQKCQIVCTIQSKASWKQLGNKKRLLTRLMARFLHGVIANSHDTKQMILDAGVPESKIHVVYNGIAVPEELPDRVSSRERLGIREDEFVIATAARLVPSKGIASLIGAFQRLSAGSPVPLLLIAGDGPERASLEQAAAKSGNIRFLGRVDNIHEVYAAADIFALPSRDEAFGLVYAEAALHNIPSIGANDGGVPEVVQDGSTGIIVPLDDENALASAIDRLRFDPDLRKKLGTAAKERTLRIFAEEPMAEGYLDYYKSLCDKGTTQPGKRS